MSDSPYQPVKTPKVIITYPRPKPGQSPYEPSGPPRKEIVK